MNPKDISAILNEYGEDRSQYFNAVAPPVVQSSNFSFENVKDFRQALMHDSADYIYSRAMNPTVKILCDKLAALDGAEGCLVVNSGSGAIFTTVLSLVKSGDHIVSVAKPYSWAQRMFDNVLPRFNVAVSYVDGTEVANFEKAITPNTTVIYLETPNSWNFALQDLAGVAALARKHGIVTVCDNSYCTPLFQQPIALGVDIAIQSGTKYLNGHSDVIAGVISGKKELIQKIYNSEFMNMGISTTPFNAWLMIRGLRTLEVRLSRISKTTEAIVHFLKGHEKVEEIVFPFDKDFSQYDLAKKQMSGACGLFSFYLKVDAIDQIERFCEALQHILMAVSWGGYESLIMPACVSFDPSGYDPNKKEQRLVRFYAGLEDPQYIIEDLQRGFAAMAIS